MQPGSLAALAGASAAHLPLLSALTVQRAVAVGLLGSSVRWRSSPVAPAAAAAGLLPPARAAVYGFEVVAAQSSGAARARAVGVLSTLRARTEQLEVLGHGDAPPPLGYDLPFAVTTPAAAAQAGPDPAPAAAAVARERLRRRCRRRSRADRAAALGRADADPGAGLGRSPDRLPGARRPVSDVVPVSLVALLRGRPAEGYLSGDDWLDRLPGLVRESLRRWDLTPDGAPLHGVCALVLPVRRTTGEAAVLKVGWPHREARHEHLALQLWGGRGAVRLLAADPASWAMLLERLDPARDLHALPVDEACAVIGQLLGRLDRPATPQLAPLSGEVAQLVRALASPPAGIPRRFVEQALGLAPRPGPGRGRRRPAGAHGPALRQRPRRAAAAVAGDRPQAARRRAGLRRRPRLVEPLGGGGGRLRRARRPAPAAVGRLRARRHRRGPRPGLDDRPRGAERAVGRGRAEAAARVTVAVTILKAMND